MTPGAEAVPGVGTHAMGAHTKKTKPLAGVGGALQTQIATPPLGRLRLTRAKDQVLRTKDFQTPPSATPTPGAEAVPGVGTHAMGAHTKKNKAPRRGWGCATK